MEQGPEQGRVMARVRVRVPEREPALAPESALAPEPVREMVWAPSVSPVHCLRKRRASALIKEWKGMLHVSKQVTPTTVI
jgi:hypothetical protein